MQNPCHKCDWKTVTDGKNIIADSNYITYVHYIQLTLHTIPSYDLQVDYVRLQLNYGFIIGNINQYFLY